MIPIPIKFLSKFILFFMFFSFGNAQWNPWNKIAQLELEGKVKSADSLIDILWKNAKLNKNEPEQIKCFLHKSRYITVLEEDSQDKIIQLLQKEKEQFQFPAINFMEQIYASILTDLYNFNRSVIDQREVIDVENNNWKLWTKKQYQDQILMAYEKSLKPKAQLLQESLKKYYDLVSFEKYSIDYQRNLFDFFWSNYFNYLNQNISYGEKDKWKIENPQNWYANTPDFVPIKTNTEDNFSKIISGFQFLENYYLQQKKEYELVRTINKRIQWVHEVFYDHQKRKDFYSKSYQSFSDNTARLSLYYIHLKHILEGATIENDIKEKVIFSCDSVVKKIGLKEPTIPFEVLKNSLQQKSLQVVLEGKKRPNQAILFKANYQNVDSLHVNVYRISSDFYFKFQKGDYANRSVLMKEDSKVLKLVDKQFFNLPIPKKDYEHSTEYYLNGLPNGNYLVAFSYQSIDSLSDEHLKWNVFEVNEMYFIEFFENNQHHFQVLDFVSGRPLPNISVHHNELIQKTNQNGKAFFTKNTKFRTNFNWIASEKDTVIISQKYNPYYKEVTANNKPKPKATKYKRTKYDDLEVRSFLYLDRAIYRPGQTVYFKGVLVQYHEDKHSYKMVANRFVQIVVEDANGNEIYKKRIQLNSFGSVFGSFDLPKNTLNGNFSISIDEDEDYEKDPMYNKNNDEHPFWDNIDFYETTVEFRVEEYKRPTFKVEIDAIKTKYRIGEEINISGVVKSFSGANASNFKIKYEFIDANNSQQPFLFSGDLETQENGTFNILLNTKTHTALLSNWENTHNYRLKIIAQEVQGEVQTAEKNITVHKNAFKLSVITSSVWIAEEKANIKINTTNYDNQAFDENVRLQIFKLSNHPENETFRPWSAPSIFSIPVETFTNLFPEYRYRDNEEFVSKRLEKVIDTLFTNTKDFVKTIANFKNWEMGRYEIYAFGLDGEDTISIKQSITLKSKEFLSNNTKLKLSFLEFEKIEKTKKLIANIQTNLAPCYLHLVLLDEDNVLQEKLVYQTTKEASYTFAFKNLDKGYRVQVYTVKNGSMLEESLQWNPIFGNESENITIENSSFRNFMEPGSNEKWTFTVKTSTNKKPIFEVLASMYDSSLDEFTTRNWELFEKHKREKWVSNRYFEGLTYNFTSKYYSIISYNSNIYRNNNGLFYANDKLNLYGLSLQKTKFDAQYYRNLYGNVSAEIVGSQYCGVVYGDDMPLPGAFVNVVGSKNGASTDFDGNFCLVAKEGDIILITYVGYNEKYLKLEASKKLPKIELEVGNQMMEEVVVVAEGYRSVTKTKTVSAVAIVSSDSLENRLNASILHALQGQISGSQIKVGSGQPGASSNIIIRGKGSIDGNTEPLYVVDGVLVTANQLLSMSQSEIFDISILKDASATALYGSRGSNGVVVISTKKGMEKAIEESMLQTKARKDFKETAFFYPNIYTNKKGEMVLSFQSPEQVTQWKLRLMAHDKKANFGYLEKSITTQKKLMITPNMPRFVRVGDELILQAKISNLTPEDLQTNGLIQITNPENNSNITNQVLQQTNLQNVLLKAKQNGTIEWKIKIPDNLSSLIIKVVASSGNFSDGEEHQIPVLSNQILVTETQPLWLKPNQTKTIALQSLQQMKPSYQPISWKLQYHANPLWTSLQALPYLIGFEHECTEQLFSKYFANSLSHHYVNQYPEIKSTLEEWVKSENLKEENNETALQITKQETPWVAELLSDKKKKEIVANLLLQSKTPEINKDILEKIKNNQTYEGLFSWFPNGRGNHFITFYLLEGFAKLQKITKASPKEVAEIVQPAIQKLDQMFWEDYKVAKKTSTPKNDFMPRFHQKMKNYLYARNSHKTNYPMPDSLVIASQETIHFYQNQWLDFNLEEKAKFALLCKDWNQEKTAKNILENILQTATNNPDWGMYWKENSSKFGNHPVETQVAVMEAFQEIYEQKEAVEEMKIWLIKNKQNNQWSTTKATTMALYGMLQLGTTWQLKGVELDFSGSNVEVKNLLAKNSPSQIMGAKEVIEIKKINSNLHEVVVKNPSEMPVYGSLQWQYLSPINEVMAANNQVVKLEKKLWKKEGIEFVEITPNQPINLGDIVKVQLIIKLNEDVTFMHLKDYRATGLEPKDVLSESKNQFGLRYYQSTKDAATHFFFDEITRGTYVLEYELKANNKGVFDAGIATLQSMYAPQNSTNSNSFKVMIQ